MGCLMRHRPPHELRLILFFELVYTCNNTILGEQVLSAEAALKAISERVAAEMNMPMILR